jgi:hypothetical protein
LVAIEAKYLCVLFRYFLLNLQKQLEMKVSLFNTQPTIQQGDSNYRNGTSQWDIYTTYSRASHEAIDDIQPYSQHIYSNDHTVQQNRSIFYIFFKN